MVKMVVMGRRMKEMVRKKRESMRKNRERWAITDHRSIILIILKKRRVKMMGMVVNHDHNYIYNQKNDLKPAPVASPPDFDLGPKMKKRKRIAIPFQLLCCQ